MVPHIHRRDQRSHVQLRQPGTSRAKDFGEARLKGEHHFHVAGQIGYRFFGELILDCLHRTEKAMTQALAFKAAELCLKAQAAARKIA